MPRSLTVRSRGKTTERCVARNALPVSQRWVFRLDEDSEVYSDVRVNMVGWMEAHGKQYGFRLWDVEDADMVWSLPELTAWYLTAKEIRPVSAHMSACMRAGSMLSCVRPGTSAPLPGTWRGAHSGSTCARASAMQGSARQTHVPLLRAAAPCAIHHLPRC